MKKNYPILFLFFFFATLNFYSQNTPNEEIAYLGEKLKIKPKTIEELKNTALIYQYHIDSLTIELNKKHSENTTNFENTLKTKTINDNINELRNKLKYQAICNYKMLNILFANEVGTYVSGATDLSLNKYYAGLDADDSSVSFSMNFNPIEDSKLKRLKWLFSIGFKAKAEDKFATIFKNGKFENNDLGITGKITLIGRGVIKISPLLTQWQLNGLMPLKIGFKAPSVIKENVIKNYRSDLLTRYDKKIKKYIENDYPKQLDSLKILNDHSTNSEADLLKETSKFINSKYEDYYEKIASDEIQFMKKNKLYNFLWDHWGSIDFFTPIGQKKYNVSLTNENPNFKSTSFYPFKINGTYTNLLKFSDGQSIYITGQISAFNNNNIKADDITKVAFQTITTQSSTQQAVIDSDDVYVVANGYNNFVTGAVKFEVDYFFCNWIGFSPAVEKNFGQYYHPFNWKIGIPVSLKDKDGKPNVNLEAQFKRVNNNDIWGISVSFLLGKFLN